MMKPTTPTKGELRKEIEELKRELRIKERRLQVVISFSEGLEVKLDKAVELIRGAKLRWAPHTTNSIADEFLAEFKPRKGWPDEQAKT